MTVHRVWTYLAANAGRVRRSLNYASFVPSAVWRAMRLGRFDVLVATSPQFFCAVAGWLAARAKRMPWVFEVRDLWPDSIRAVGAVRSGWVLRCLERLELRLYRSATAVVCVTRSFVEQLQQRGVPIAKLHFVPNGVEIDEWRGIDRNAVRTELGLAADEVAVAYVGTLGMAHGLGTILEAAERLRQRAPRVRFLVVGEGAEGQQLRQEAAERGLGTVRFFGLVPRERAREILSAADVALVLLKRTPLFEFVLPSKMFEAMAAGVPILLGVGGEAKRVLDASGGGVAIQPEDAEALAGEIERLANDPEAREELGFAGREFVVGEFARSRWAKDYLQILQNLLPDADA